VPLPVTIFIFSLVWPTGLALTVGGLFLPIYRVALLVLLPLATFEILNKRIRLTLPDWLIAAFTILQAISLIYHHGLTEPITVVSMNSISTTTAFINSGTTIVETLGPYLLARAFIRSQAQALAAMRLVIIIALILGTTTLVESWSGYSIYTLSSAIDDSYMRFGLHRASGPFPHPILFGLFCATALAFTLAISRPQMSVPKRGLLALLLLVAVFTSASSAAFAACAIQVALIIWYCASAGLKHRGWYLFVGSALVYVIIASLSNRTPMQVIFSYTALNSWTGYYRTLIWQYGWQNFLESPFFGIGFNDWIRPNWMTPSIDAFWLVILLRYGFIAAAPLIAAFLICMQRVGRALPKQTRRFDIPAAYCWIASMTSIVIAGFTVHFWMQSFVVLFFMLGLWRAFERPDRIQSQGARA
jgi:hypothetical protein